MTTKKKQLKYNDFLVTSGVYLLWNKLVPQNQIDVEMPERFICEVNASQESDFMTITVASIEFNQGKTQLELEIQAHDDNIKLNPQGTSIELRKRVNKDLSVGTENISLELDAGESKRVMLNYKHIKFNERLRELEIVFRTKRFGNHKRQTLILLGENIRNRSTKVSSTKLDLLEKDQIHLALLGIYLASLFIVLICMILLRLIGIPVYVIWIILAPAVYVISRILKHQFAKSLAIVGYQEPLSLYKKLKASNNGKISF